MKRVVFIADSLDNAYRFQRILSGLDAEVAASSTVQMRKNLTDKAPCDLLIFEARGAAFSRLDEALTLGDERISAVLVIVDEQDVGRLALPDSVPSDFVVQGASDDECTVRMRRLLRMEDESTGTSDVIIVDSMTINLATYQVTVAGQPVDFTYLEYALLSFLAKHPGRTFSRDALLSRVWGFDYYGGSRTVDVHVRRIRAKLGPDLAQHLETVRGVGYLWNA
jgi:DNA-binding response OmpR family regulator